MSNQDNTMEERFDEFSENLEELIGSRQVKNIKAFIASEKQRSRWEGVEEVLQLAKEITMKTTEGHAAKLSLKVLEESFEEKNDTEVEK